ncbi:GDSL-type esterase/lipase family protein [Jiulongibacter sediminis]|jgi:lysophospholipase L1-like esterase|uniref:SGNH/GDSL hydrolase family protein n=1 Tax=Jiulongibacter sediminis TaxID=1605367 RepID=UPI0026F2E426|nr:GDSL-type esterase/lipase family protein [Jiulongibacter sediminis]
MPYFFIVLFSLTLYFLYFKKVVLRRPPLGYPEGEYSSSGKIKMLCLGDSNTHGNMSYDWVGQLRKELPDLTILNGGRNADLTFTLLKRLEDNLKCNPDLVTLLIGTNDANARLNNQNEKRYRELGKITSEEKPDFENFKKNYISIIDKIQTETKAKIALISLPLITEDLNHPGNSITEEYSRFIQETANQKNLDFLDFRTRQKQFLHEHSETRWTYKNYRLMMDFATLLRNVFRLDWDQISRAAGTETTPDFIHLNDTSGREIARLVSEWSRKYMTQ